MISKFSKISRSFFSSARVYYSNIVDITSDNFTKEVEESEIPVVVDCYASWCGPCKVLVPLLEDIISSSYEGVKLAKIDVEEELELAQGYGVSSIPAVFGVVNNEVVDQFVGLKEEAEIRDFIDSLLEKVE